jgi:hypothetical protein
MDTEHPWVFNRMGKICSHSCDFGEAGIELKRNNWLTII